MSKIVFFPTNNIGKYERYKKSFEKHGIEYNRYLLDCNGEEIKVEVVEDGKTTRENAEKKAKGYYDKYKKRICNNNFSIITTDEALYIDGLADNEQPGVFVRRFNGLDGKRATDQEVVDRYTSFVKKLGGEAKAKWHYSLVMYNGKKFYYLDWDEHVLFSDTPHFPITKGYVLNNITIVEIDENGNKIMLSDLSDEEKEKYLAKYTDNVSKFINENILEAELGER